MQQGKKCYTLIKIGLGMVELKLGRMVCNEYYVQRF